ncbi:MAG TPA: hypothetical protein VG474_11075, partial [Solirubrobacteraceae bacterium]|nr:hypothetical protein [Solirubrobacteraceae bacterium]
MAAPRGLFASVGASAMLVAAAALSLLAVSAVFAFGGWSSAPSASVERPALVFAGGSPPPAAARSAARPGVLRPPVQRASRTARPTLRAGTSSAVRAAQPPLTSRPVTTAKSLPELSPPERGSGAPPPPPPPAAPQPRVGDGVRKAGEGLSATVKGTGAALGAATQPLAPPVSTAVQQVLNFVAELVART